MWTDEVLSKLNRRKAFVAFSPHLFDRGEERHLNLDYVEQTVRSGKVVVEKCRRPGKFCFERYFGKENRTYTVIALFHEDFVEVKTCWTRKGR